MYKCVLALCMSDTVKANMNIDASKERGYKYM
jgi:hypothetical protein